MKIQVIQFWKWHFETESSGDILEREHKKINAPQKKNKALFVDFHLMYFNIFNNV